MATGTLTVYVSKKGKTAACEVDFQDAHALTDVTFELVTVDTTTDVAKQEADCRSHGQGTDDPPGQ